MQRSARKRMLFWILNSKMWFGLQENISFTRRESIQKTLIVDSILRLNHVARFTQRVEGCSYSILTRRGPDIIIWVHSSISVCLRERLCACLSVWVCFHSFRSCSGLSVAFLLSSLVLSKCYCRVFRWDESAYVYINRREYNWLYTSYTPVSCAYFRFTLFFQNSLPRFSSTQTLWECKLEYL